MLSCVPTGTVTFSIGVGAGGAAGWLDCAESYVLPLALDGGTVVRRPLSPLSAAELERVELDLELDLELDARSRVRGEGRSTRAAGGGGLLLACSCGWGGSTAALPGATCRLLMTVFTPDTCPASLAAA